MVDAGHKSIALYPGAFRPPHSDHFDAVLELAARKDVDEVVVIISNRARMISGTTLALDVDVAEQIWSIYLRGFPNVTVEVAPTTAVRWALDRVRTARAGERFLLAVGAKDYEDGKGRFNKLSRLGNNAALIAEVIPLKPRKRQLSGTMMRSLLAQGETAEATFVDCLPEHLSTHERSEVWSLCRKSQIDRAEAARRRIAAVLDRGGMKALSIAPVDSAKANSAYEVSWHTADGQTNYAFAKYANDAVSADSRTRGGKSRRRLKAEVKALRWINSISRPEVTSVQVPHVLRFENETRTLLLTAVMPKASDLAHEVRHGLFDSSAAAVLGRFLGVVHNSVPPPYFWGDEESDHKHWLEVLDKRSSDLSLQQGVEPLMAELKSQSISHASRGFRHLDLSGTNIRIDQGHIGVIDFETATSFGDPALDIGTVVGWYAWGGARNAASAQAVLAIHRFLREYRLLAGTSWKNTAPLVIAFAGLTLLAMPTSSLHDYAAGVELLEAGTGGRTTSVENAVLAALDQPRLDTGLTTSDDDHGPDDFQFGQRRRVIGSTGERPPGSVSISSANNDVITVEVHGGPPHTVLELHVDRSFSDYLPLDATGSGRLTKRLPRALGLVEIRNGSEVLLVSEVV